MKFFNFRLKPNQDVRFELFKLAQENSLKASAVIAAVGSLQVAHLRLASGKTSTVFQGPFEIVSFSGTLSAKGLHIHLSLADNEGRVIGGHLTEGCLVNTTLELVILEQEGIEFCREADPATGYQELVVKKI